MKKDILIIVALSLTVLVGFSGCDLMLPVGSTLVDDSRSESVFILDIPYIPPDITISGLVPPRMVHFEQPPYPRLARQAGLEGVVWIRALVDTSGAVQEAMIYRSSGTPSLDEAALSVAHLNLFTPALYRGEPISMWVAYEVEFKLDRR